MNDQLKADIEQSAGKHWEEDNRNLDGVNPYAYLLGFKTGASYLYKKGYRFTEEDMRVAYSAGGEDEYTGRNFDRWLEERRKSNMTNPKEPITPTVSNADNLNYRREHPGLTKLEYFAGLIMQGLLSRTDINVDGNEKYFTAISVNMAKALIEQPNKESNE